MSVPTRNFFRSCFGYLCCVTIPSSPVEDTLAQETLSTPLDVPQPPLAPAVHDYSSKPPVQETDSHLSSTQQSQAPPAQDPEASDLRPDGDTSHETPLDVLQPSLAPTVPNYSSTPPVQETDSQSQAPPAQDLEGSDLHPDENARTSAHGRSLTPSDLPRHPLAPAVHRYIFRPAPWLGGKHDGYPLLSFKDYMHRSRTMAGVEEVAAHAQSHLTFGLLEAVMETKLSESILLSNNDGCTVLVDDHLPNLLADWRSRIRQLAQTDIDKCRQWAQRVEEALSAANRLLLLELTQSGRSPFRLAHIPWESHSAILLASAAIGEALTSSRRVFPVSLRQGISWTFIHGLTDLRHKGMVQSGWCPFVARIVGDTGVCSLGYASTRTPFVRDGDGDGHAKCSTEACIINDIDSSTYRNRHVEPSCDCPFIIPPLEPVLQTLQLGEIPVVQYDSTRNEFSVLRASEVSYVAISHVWADGLGSTTEKGLPRCQIQGLSKKVKQVVSNDAGAFWMDSLCVPEMREMRKRAIGLMAKTYRNASTTLVLDSGIRHCSVSAPLEEKLLAILSCGWMQRLWTLQEGLLARRLIFVFADGLTDVGDLIPVGDVLDCLLTNLASEIFRLTKYQHSLHRDSSVFGIGDLARSLVWRTTSKAEDETLAIAGLANVDARELANLPPDERMRTFLLRVEKLPPNIIFMSVPKLKEPGFSWAPQTLMQKGGSIMAVSDEYEAICTPNGLLAEYAVVYFTPEKSVRSDVQWFLFDTSKDRYYKARVLIPDNSEGEKRTYSCNALLMAKLPRPMELVACAAVLVTGADAEERGDRMVCGYRQRLILESIPQSRLQQEKLEDVVMAKSGKMLTRVI